MRWRRDSEFINIVYALQNRNLATLNRDVAQRLMNGHSNLQESSALSRNIISKIEQSVFEDKSISVFKYIVFNTGFQPFALLDSDSSLVLVDQKRVRILSSDVPHAMTSPQLRSWQRKCTRELCRTMEAVWIFSSISSAIAEDLKFLGGWSAYKVFLTPKSLFGPLLMSNAILQLQERDCRIPTPDLSEPSSHQSSPNPQIETRQAQLETSSHLHLADI